MILDDARGVTGATDQRDDEQENGGDGERPDDPAESGTDGEGDEHPDDPATDGDEIGDWQHEWWQHGDVAYKDVPAVNLVHVHKLATEAHRTDFYDGFKTAITATLARTLRRLTLADDKAPPWVTSSKDRRGYKDNISDMLVELLAEWCDTALGWVDEGGEWASTRVVLPVYFENKQMDGRAREALMYESPLNTNLFVALQTPEAPMGITVEGAVTQFWNDLATVGAFGVLDDGTHSSSHQFVWPAHNSVASKNDFVGRVVGHSAGSGALAASQLNTCGSRTEGLTHTGKVERFSWALRQPKIKGALGNPAACRRVSVAQRLLLGLLTLSAQPRRRSGARAQTCAQDEG